MKCLILKRFITINLILFLGYFLKLNINSVNVNDVTLNEAFKTFNLSSTTLIKGTLLSGNDGFLEYDDRKVVNISSNNGEISYQIDFNVGSLEERVDEIELSLKTNVNQTIDIKFFNGNNYELLESIGLETKYRIHKVSLVDANNYIQNSTVSIRLVIESQTSIVMSLDKAILLSKYNQTESNYFVQNYTFDKANVEIGNANNLPTALKFFDKSYYSVASDGKKVAWSSKITLDQSASLIDTLVIKYVGYSSVETNDIWMSVYNFETNNFEVVATIESNSSTTERTVIISDYTKINRYVSADNDLEIRLYNSATTEFVRHTDYLNISIYGESLKNVSKLKPNAYYIEYGLGTGLINTIEKFDNDNLIINSDSAKKVAVQVDFNTTIPNEKIHTITVSINTFDTGVSNNIYISLYNYETNNFVVHKTTSSQTISNKITFTILDYFEIKRYVSGNGNVKLRIYNSSTSSFTRYIDYAEVLIEEAENSSFEIAQLSDVHELIGSTNFNAIINELNNVIKPKLTVITGDVTDHGTPAQFNLFATDVVKINGPVYVTPGNHDSRWWNSNGKNDFIENVGPLYQSFNYKGIHFALLDTTVNMELDGKINKKQLEWLKNDLQAIPNEMPVILFGHHPFKISNNIVARNELMEAVKDKNVIAFMAGHLHYYYNIVDNGIPVNAITYIKDNNNREFVTIFFTSRKYYIYKHNLSLGTKTLWLTGTMKNTRKTSYEISNLNVLSNGNVEVEVTINNAPDKIISVDVQIDNYGEKVSLSYIGNNVWSGVVNISTITPSLPKGKHFVGVEVKDGLEQSWFKYREYYWESGVISTNWIFETLDIIQASPTYFNGRVYVGSQDHNLYCIDDLTGVKLWSFQAGDAITSAPAIYQGTNSTSVLFGSNDKKLYSIDSITGALNWSFSTNGSVISNPLIYENKVIFGSGDNKIYALNAETGTLLWSYQTGGLMRQKPVVRNGIIYAFVRDTYIWYAIDIQTGNLYWRGNANTDESLFVCGDIAPIIANNKLWAIDAQNTRLAELDLNTGVINWTSSINLISSRGFANDNNNLYFTSNNGRIVYAMNMSNNQIIWTLDLRYNSLNADHQASTINCALVYSNGKLIHTSERGTIRIINPITGVVEQSYDATGYPERVFWSTPTVVDNKIYLSGIDGKVYKITFQP